MPLQTVLKISEKLSTPAAFVNLFMRLLAAFGSLLWRQWWLSVKSAENQ
jgi:hypothetical protein